MDIISCILPIVIAVLSFFTGYYYHAMLMRKKTDGKIIIDEADAEGHAGMNLEFDIEYDELMKRNIMIFEVENHLQTIDKAS